MQSTGTRFVCKFADLRLAQRGQGRHSRQTWASVNACLITSNACSADGDGGASLRGFRVAASIFAAAMASTWASPSWLSHDGRVQLARELLGLGRGRQHVPHQVVVPPQAAIARQLRSGVPAGRGVHLSDRVALKRGKAVGDAATLDARDDLVADAA